MSEVDPVVGHKTLVDGSHEPLRKSEADAIWAAVELADQQRKELMPGLTDALSMLGQVSQRLKDLGWRDAIYCPKDGSVFEVIEFGSTGIHDCHYEGEWPNGSWWTHSDGDLWPSRPVLFRKKEHPMPDPDNVRRVADGLTEGEARRLIDGRTDWRDEDWQDHCGDPQCEDCTGWSDTHIAPSRLSPEDQILRTYLLENPHEQ